MTKLNVNNFIKPLKADLDENIVQHVRISENTIIDIINPCTGTLDQIKITHKPYVTDDIVNVMYVIDTEGRDRSSPDPVEVLVTDLEDLYEWILIEDTEEPVK
jgi:hypothetical protein